MFVRVDNRSEKNGSCSDCVRVMMKIVVVVVVVVVDGV